MVPTWVHLGKVSTQASEGGGLGWADNEVERSKLATMARVSQ